jgi:IPT/TIG domain
MAIVDENGAVLNKTGLQALTTTVSYPTDRVLTAPVYETFQYRGQKGFKTGRRLKYRTGQVVTQAAVDALYANNATVTNVSPNTGVATAGGTKVTITGTNFDGVTNVTFGGANGTNLKIESNTKLTVTAPARTAGSHAVVVVDDAAGNVAAGNVTYA